MKLEPNCHTKALLFKKNTAPTPRLAPTIAEAKRCAHGKAKRAPHPELAVLVQAAQVKLRRRAAQGLGLVGPQRHEVGCGARVPSLRSHVPPGRGRTETQALLRVLNSSPLRGARKNTEASKGTQLNEGPTNQRRVCVHSKGHRGGSNHLQAAASSGLPTPTPVQSAHLWGTHESAGRAGREGQRKLDRKRIAGNAP
jgi:hypothetical protein